MTIAELAEKLEVSEHYIQHHFPQIKRGFEKRGIQLVKIGRGQQARYGMGKTEDSKIKF